MAGDQYVAATEAFALTGGTAGYPLSVYSTAGARRMNLNEMGISFNGTSASATPVLVRLMRVSGTPGGSAATQSPTAVDPAAPSSTFSAVQGTTATAATILRTYYVPPTSGLDIQYPLGQEPDGPATTNSGLVIYCNAPASVSVTAYMVYSE